MTDAQITTGLRSVLSLPSVYSSFQNLVGAQRLRRDIVDHYIRPTVGDTVLDIGCGPGDMLAFLPDVDYVGVDMSEDYIHAARETHGGRGEFYVGDAQDMGRVADQKFDLILAIGLLHHMDGEGAKGLFQFSASVLNPAGRMITLDPCFCDGQASLARWLVSLDRGQNIRTKQEYLELAEPAFGRVTGDVRDDLLRMPYTHCVLVCEA